MKLCTLLIFVWMACSVTDALKCYVGIGDGMKETDCTGVLEVAGLTANACAKVDNGHGNVVRSCAIKTMEGCVEGGVASVCQCTTDLCNGNFSTSTTSEPNGTSNTRTSSTFYFLVVTLAMIVASSCMKLTFL